MLEHYSEVLVKKFDEVFYWLHVKTNIGHFRAAVSFLKQFKGTLPTRFVMFPPVRKWMEAQLMEERLLKHIYGKAGVRMEMSGCFHYVWVTSTRTCRGEQYVTSTRNFPTA